MTSGGTASQANFDMFVFTRFGVGVTDPDWLSTRLKLFEAITVPSLLAQTDQRFRWNLFVGSEPLDWVVRRLRDICEPFGDRMEVLHAAQRYVEMRAAVMRHRTTSHMVTAIIDDDDAWHVETVARAVRNAARIAAEGVEKFGFTFPRGYEWLVTDLIDIDKLSRGERIIRKAAAYPYVRPYLGTSCFTFSRHEECFEKIGGLHATVGEILRDAGFDSRILEEDQPSWLYVRHQQADSSIRKARTDAMQLSLDALQRDFGIDPERVERFRAEAGTIRYAAKRTHQRSDKSNLTFDLSPTTDFREGDERLPRLKVGMAKRPEAGRYVFNPREEYAILAPECRLAIYDNKGQRFCVLDVIRSDIDTFVPVSALPSADCKFKLQVQLDGKWVDDVAYARLMPAIASQTTPIAAPAAAPPVAPAVAPRPFVPGGSLADRDALALAAFDVQLLHTSSLFDLSSPEGRKSSNRALGELFLRLHAIVRPDVVLELGACDASFSRQARKRVPQAQIIAFEANPHNYEKFKSHSGLKEARVEYLHLAVSDRAGQASFFIQKSRAGRPVSPNTGSNSMLERMGDVEQERISVQATSVDTFLSQRALQGTMSAWIDVEGAIRQALLGMEQRLADFCMILCEVEERAHWKDQWLWLDVLPFLTARGFVPVARDFEYTTQHNVVFLRRELLARPDIRFAIAQHYSSLGRSAPAFGLTAT